MRRRIAWGYSSAGRALEWHSRGQRFDPAYLHHPNGRGFRLSRFFLFMPRFARCIRRRTRWQRLPAPVPRLPPRPTRPKAARPPAKRRRSRHPMRVGRNGLPTHRRKRETRGAPAFGFLAVRFFNPAAVTPHAAKNSPAGSALFHAVIRCALLLTTTTAAASPTAKTPAPDVGAQRHRAADALSRRQFPQNRASECPSARTPPAKRAHTGSLSKKDTPTGKTHKSLTDKWILRYSHRAFERKAPVLRAYYKNVKEYFIETCFASFHRCKSVLRNRIF